jgi:hypothetical protein
LQDAELK